MIVVESWKKLNRSQVAETATLQYNFPDQQKALSSRVIIADKCTDMELSRVRPLEQFAGTANRQIILKMLVSSKTRTYGSSRRTDLERDRDQVK